MSIRDALHSLHSVSAFKVVSTFADNPMRAADTSDAGHRGRLTDVVTDLPVQRVTYVGRAGGVDTSGQRSSGPVPSHVVRTADVEGAGVDYFSALLKVDRVSNMLT